MIVGNVNARPREIFTVTRHLGGWAVEHNGAYSQVAASKEEARAEAHKQARAAHDKGLPCQVIVSDETGFFLTGQTLRVIS